MIDGDPARAVSMRELAREAGVSAGAPYRHFASHDALVAALAARWMRDFVDAQEAAARGGERDALIAAGTAYVQWATQHPHRFAVIYDPAVQHTDDPDLRAQIGRHIELLAALVARASQHGIVEPTAAERLWSTVHGLATLVVLGHVRSEAVPAVLTATVGVASG